MRSRAIAFAIVASVPIALVAVASLVQWIPRFFDPCYEWGTARAGSTPTRHIRKGQLGSVVAPPNGFYSAQTQGPCARQMSATTETRGHAEKRLAIVSGGLLIASALGLAGVLRSMPLVTITGSAILFLESIALVFTLSPLTLFAGILLLLAARQIRLAKGRLSASGNDTHAA